MKKIFFLMSAALVSLAMNAGLRTAGEVIECKLYSTNFQNWESVPSSATPSTKTVTTRYSNEELTFTFAETQIAPDGTNSKFTADVITTGYAMAAKTATPYIQTSALGNVTKVHFVHAATGGSRGWGLQYKTAEDADWVTVSNSYCEQAGTAKDVTINKENVQLRWYNLNSSQNAYMTEFAIYGMAEDDGMPTEYTITYYDQNGNRLGDSVQNETQTLAFAFSAADLTIPEGYKFRGWYDSDKKRHVEGEALTADLRLNAMVTPIEVAEVGKYYVYDLTKNYFYEDDHECFIPANGAYHNEHGWHFAANGTISLPVAGKAYVKIGLCKWSDEANVTVTTKGGENVTTFPSKVETDNTVESFFYDGNADTIVMTFGAQAYIHSVAVYNVQAKAEKGTHGYYEIAGGDVAAFLMVLDQLQAGDKIFLHNGLYDLGDKVLTLISKNNVSIIGQSMEGVIIKNAPDVKAESIDKTATLKINDNISGTYLQDLTIQNALNYYKANNGRAVCLQDRGTKTICKNVRLLSYQDTYYSNKQGAVKYFEDCEIHGTVDFICGDGSVYFKNNLLYAEQRPSNTNALTASNAAASDKGFVFESCRVQSETAFSFGRLWGNAPQCVFLNTIIEKPSDLLNPHWTAQTINAGAWPGQAGYVGEFNTKDAENNVLTPASHQVTFKDGSSARDYETVLSAEVAATFTMEYTLGDWSATAAADATQAVCEETAAEFEPNGIYLVEAEGEPAAIILGSEFMDRFALYNGVNYTIRKANARGGFGKSAGNESGEDIENTNVCNTQTLKLIRDGQIVIVRDNKEYNVLGAQL